MTLLRKFICCEKELVSFLLLNINQIHSSLCSLIQCSQAPVERVFSFATSQTCQPSFWEKRMGVRSNFMNCDGCHAAGERWPTSRRLNSRFCYTHQLICELGSSFVYHSVDVTSFVNLQQWGFILFSVHVWTLRRLSSWPRPVSSSEFKPSAIRFTDAPIPVVSSSICSQCM